MRKFNKEQLRVVVMNCFFDVEEDHDEFSKWWQDRLSGNERTDLVDKFTELLAKRLDIEN